MDRRHTEIEGPTPGEKQMPCALLTGAEATYHPET